MEKRELAQLAIYEIEKELDMLPLTCLEKLYLEKTSEIIYILKDGKLYGVVSMGEALGGWRNAGLVKINKSFTFLENWDIVKAHEIFKRRLRIHKIPVINQQRELIGDYSRWDDLLYIQRNQACLMREEAVKKVLGKYEKIYVVKPVGRMCSVYSELMKYFEKFGIQYVELKKEYLEEKLTEKAICIFQSEDERRGMQCLCGIEPRKYDYQGYNNFRFDIPEDSRWRMRLATYKSLLYQLAENLSLESLHIKKPFELQYENIDEKATVLLSELQHRGLRCIHLCQHNEVEEFTDFEINFRKELREKNHTYHGDLRNPWPQREENEEFYGELYQNEDYEKGIAQREISKNWQRFEYGKDVQGKYFNAREGRRVTCFQPEKYVGTVYVVGACAAVGSLVEDAHTIESFLQKKLLKKGYSYRVENIGTWVQYTAIENRLREIGKFYENDILIMIDLKRALGVPEQSFEKIFERHRISVKWITNMYVHCNWKTNQLIAEDIVKELQPYLSCGKVQKRNELEINLFEIMNTYVKHKYLNKYFLEFSHQKYNTIGAVVINCNPFTKGHRYLIEQALKHVDFLIVFVIEEDKSMFPFEERFKMAMDGTKDLENVMVVPSGSFILSMNNFSEYFTHSGDESITAHAEYDVTVFADYIAKALHITHRFAGEELTDKTKAIYNNAMKNILPKRGIEFVEIPRMIVKSESVTGFKVIRFMNNKEYDKAFAMLTDVTKEYLLQQLNCEEVAGERTGISF